MCIQLSNHREHARVYWSILTHYADNHRLVTAIGNKFLADCTGLSCVVMCGWRCLESTTPWPWLTHVYICMARVSDIHVLNHFSNSNWFLRDIIEKPKIYHSRQSSWVWSCTDTSWEISKKLEMARKSRCAKKHGFLTQHHFCLRFPASSGTVSRYEKGASKFPWIYLTWLPFPQVPPTPESTRRLFCKRDSRQTCPESKLQ